MSKHLPRLLIVFLVVIFVIGAYLIFRLRLLEETPSTPSESRMEEVVNLPDSPIKKATRPDGSQVKYDIAGSFIGEIRPSERILGNSYSGEFVMKDDPLNRKIPVILGSENGTISLGTYEGTFESRSTWTTIPVDQAVQKLETGEEVQLIIIYGVPTLAQDLLDDSADAQLVLDTLLSETNSGQYSYKIPEDISALNVFGIGVVR